MSESRRVQWSLKSLEPLTIAEFGTDVETKLFPESLLSITAGDKDTLGHVSETQAGKDVKMGVIYVAKLYKFKALK